MSYDWNGLKKRTEEVHDWFREELARLKTGRATPALIEKVMIDAYGNRQPIVHVASVNIEDPKTLRVSPWDKNLVAAVQSAIDKANLGVSTAPDEQGVRVIFPEMTEETRQKTIKLVKERLEEARVSLRQAREEVWSDLQKKEREKEISEDEKFTHKEEMQKIIDEWIARLDETARKKETDLLTK